MIRRDRLSRARDPNPGFSRAERWTPGGAPTAWRRLGKLRLNWRDTKMKFFLDTANLDELRKGAAWGIVDGVTTNPSLIAKEGKPLEEHIREICGIIDGDISAEVVATMAIRIRPPSGSLR